MTHPPKQIVAVASGKGGVGKTTVAVNLAVALAQKGFQVGLLDADLYGPDAALMLGITRHEPATHIDVWRPDAQIPPVLRHGVKVFSLQFMIGEDQSFAVHTTFASMLLDRMLGSVQWGALDYLLVDLPPGTTDVQQHLVRIGLAGVVVVVTPQDVAHLDARKLVTTLLRDGIRVIGGVENMAGFTCPCCGTSTPLFPAVAHDRSIWSQGVERLASLPFSGHDAAGQYLPLVLGGDGSPTRAALLELTETLVARTSG